MELFEADLQAFTDQWAFDDKAVAPAEAYCVEMIKFRRNAT